jgi:hypothetical protein
MILQLGAQAFPCFGSDCGCLDCAPPRSLGHYGQSTEAAVGAGVTAAASQSSTQPAAPSGTQSVLLGVASGLLIWLITRSLDRHVFPRGVTK